MLSAILIVSIALLVFLSAFISNNSTLFDRRRKGWKIITKIGWKIVGINTLIIGLALLQFFLLQSESDKRDNKMRKAYTESVERILKSQDINRERLKYSYDTTSTSLKKNYEVSSSNLKKSYDTSSTNVVKALAEYGLDYNAAKDKIVKSLKSSTKPDPVFQLFPGQEISVVDSILGIYKINFISSDGGSDNFKLFLISSMELEDGQLKFGNTISDIFPTSPIGANSGFSTKMTNAMKFKYLFLYLTGSFTNLDSSKIFYTHNIYRFDRIRKETSVISGNYYSRIKSFIISASGMK